MDIYSEGELARTHFDVSCATTCESEDRVSDQRSQALNAVDLMYHFFGRDEPYIY